MRRLVEFENTAGSATAHSTTIHHRPPMSGKLLVVMSFFDFSSCDVHPGSPSSRQGGGREKFAERTKGQWQKISSGSPRCKSRERASGVHILTAIKRRRAHANLADRISHAPALRDQHINLPQLRYNLFRLVPLLPRHSGPPY